MLFCSTAFCGLSHSFDLTSTSIQNINDVELRTAYFDELYVSSDGSQQYTENIPSTWQPDTVLHALFNGNLSAGNTDGTIQGATAFIIRRRMVGTNKWTSIAEIPVTAQSDLDFVYIDRYARAGVNYEYALIPVLNGNEGYLNVSYITPEFEGIFIMERKDGFHGLITPRLSTSKNRPSAVVNTIDKKYPYVVVNGNNNYYSGSASSVFVRTDKDMYDWQFYDSWQYREALMEFLCNGKAKILKHFDGRMYLISVVDNPVQDESISNFYPTTVFNWVEIGDPENTEDLYKYGFTEYNENGF